MCLTRAGLGPKRVHLSLVRYGRMLYLLMKFLNADRAVGRFVRHVIGTLPPSTAVPVLSGPLRGCRWRVRAGVNSCWLGTYEPAKVRLFAEHVHDGDLVYDVGAHAGYYSLVAARRGGRTVAVEPHPVNADNLRTHARLNKADIRIVEGAVAAASGSAFLDVDDTGYQGRVADAGLAVTAIALDDLCDKFGTPDIVKMDIEGGELAALAPCRAFLSTTRSVFLATHGVAVRHACTDLLRARGFDVDTIGHPDELIATRL